MRSPWLDPTCCSRSTSVSSSWRVKGMIQPLEISASLQLVTFTSYDQYHSPMCSLRLVMPMRLHKSGSLWLDEFKMTELDEIMRQKGDSHFAQFCVEYALPPAHKKTARCWNPEWSQSSWLPSWYTSCLSTKSKYGRKNKLKLQEIAPEEQQEVIKSIDHEKDKHTQMLGLRMPDKAKTGELVSELPLAVGAKVMLTVNVDVFDGLVNGARGTVEAVIKIGSEVTLVLVKVDHSRVGTKAITKPVP